MYNNSFRIRFATGTFTLPIIAGLAAGLWLISGYNDWNAILGLLWMILATFLLTELNNRNALIRIRSLIISSTMLMLFTTTPSLHRWSWELIPMMCLVLSYFQFFSAYQNSHPEGPVFCGFLFLGIASWLYPPLLLCAPILYFNLMVQLRALTWKSFIAGIFGLVLPFWCQAGWAIWHQQLDLTFLPFLDAFHFSMPDYGAIPADMLALIACTTLMAIPACVHFYITAYNDKIRTRMFYYIIMGLEIFILAACWLQPQHYKIYAGLLLTNSTPLIAHHFALGRGLILDYWFIVCLILLGALTLFNYLDLWIYL